MSKITALVPYRTETFRSRPGQENATFGTSQSDSESTNQRGKSWSKPERLTGFIAQLIVNSDTSFRKVLGRQDVISARENAYRAALDNRPSARMSFLHAIKEA